MKTRVNILFCAAVVVLFSTSAIAETAVWNGAASGSSEIHSRWNKKQNWGGVAVTPSSTTDLIFGGTTRLNNKNDFADHSAFRSITFNSSAGAFTLNGNAITLYGGITNNSTRTQTVNPDIALTGMHYINSAAGDITINGVISGSGSLVKSGANTLTLTGNNTYSGTTTIASGSLIVNGSLQSQMITVSAGATLGGSGTVGAVTMDFGSFLSVGNSPGKLTFNDELILSEGSINFMSIISDSVYDIIEGSGTNSLTASSDFIFDFTDNTTVTNGSTYAVLQNWGTIDASQATFETMGLDPALSLDTSKLESDGLIKVIPEPTAISLLGIGALLSLIISRLHRRATGLR